MITTADKIRVLRRELAMRKSVYPGRVRSGSMKADAADFEIEAMAAILVDYEVWAAESEPDAATSVGADEAEKARRVRLNGIYAEHARPRGITGPDFRALYDACMEAALDNEEEAEALLVERLTAPPQPPGVHVPGDIATPAPALAAAMPEGEAAMREAMAAGLSIEGVGAVLRLAGVATVAALTPAHAAWLRGLLDEPERDGYLSRVESWTVEGIEHEVREAMAACGRRSDPPHCAGTWTARIATLAKEGVIGAESAVALQNYVDAAAAERLDSILATMRQTRVAA